MGKNENRCAFYDTISDFIDALDKQFIEWGRKEEIKSLNKI